MPARVAKRKKKLVICNLQKTPLDDVASLHIHAKTDDLLVALTKELNLEIPTFILHRRVAVSQLIKKSPSITKLNVKIRGVDVDGVPSSFISKIEATINSDKSTKYELSKEPFRLELNKVPTDPINITLHFMGHYMEPSFTFVHHVTTEAKETIYQLDYNPLTFQWSLKNENTNDKSSKAEMNALDIID